MEHREAAVWVRRARKSYGSNRILDDLNMTVSTGSIYGLLGASGCGKTTLLSMIVGSKKADHGQVYILGRLPGEKPDEVGYMPQDVALIEEFSIRDALHHFGWLYGMPNEQISERIQFLKKLLDLPPLTSLIRNLSGGQRRRVSLAVTLIHNPSVLILDEPTVGLDPELRKQIWDYLTLLAKEEGKTIIITTHYIEEARQADSIGLMRNGRLLTEGSPQSLLEKYNCDSVEQVFLLLSRSQQDGVLGESETDSPSLTTVSRPQMHKPSLAKRLLKGFHLSSKNHAKALMTKNLLKFVRNESALAFCFILPIVQASLFITAIGDNPKNMAIAIVNNELGNFPDCKTFSANNTHPVHKIDADNCKFNGLSCRFLEGLPQELQNHVFYKTSAEARQAVVKGKAILYIEIHSNFSRKLELVAENEKLTSRDLDEVQINIYEDKSNFPVVTFVEKSIYDTYSKFSESVEKECGFSGRAAQIPMRRLPPIYKTRDDTYTEFVAPGFMVTCSILLTISLSALTIVTERCEGIWDRTLVAGATKTEFLIWHFVTMLILNLAQNLVMFVVVFFVFNIQCNGNLFTVLVLLTFQGFSATAMGMMLSIISKNITDCIQISLGMSYPLLVLSGYVWPLEGMHPAMRFFCYYFVPSTMTVDAMSNVIRRGWDITNVEVAKGLYSSLIWCGAFLVFNIIILKMEKR